MSTKPNGGEIHTHQIGIQQEPATNEWGVVPKEEMQQEQKPQQSNQRTDWPPQNYQSPQHQQEGDQKERTLAEQRYQQEQQKGNEIPNESDKGSPAPANPSPPLNEGPVLQLVQDPLPMANADNQSAAQVETPILSPPTLAVYRDDDQLGLHNPRQVWSDKRRLDVCNYDGQEFNILWTGFVDLNDPNPYPTGMGEIQVLQHDKVTPSIKYEGRFDAAVHPEGRRFLDLISVIIRIYYPNGDRYEGKGFFGGKASA